MLAKNRRLISAKSIFKDLFRGKRLENVPFLPFIFELAARVEQVTTEQLQNDPGLMVNALLNTRQVTGVDVVLTRVDLSFSAQKSEGCGFTAELHRHGKAAVSLEATRRLREIIGKQAVLACQVTGPLTLARSYPGFQEAAAGEYEQSSLEAARQAVLQVIKVIGESRPDLILIKEKKIAPETAGEASATAACLEPLWNIIRFYDAEPLLVSQEIGGRTLDSLAGEVSGIVFSDSFDCRLSELSRLHQEKGVCFGLPLPGEVFTGRHELLDGFLDDIKEAFDGRGVFACSCGEIPPDTRLESLKTVAGLLKSSQADSLSRPAFI